MVALYQSRKFEFDFQLILLDRITCDTGHRGFARHGTYNFAMFLGFPLVQHCTEKNNKNRLNFQLT